MNNSISVREDEDDSFGISDSSKLQQERSHKTKKYKRKTKSKISNFPVGDVLSKLQQISPVKIQRQARQANREKQEISDRSGSQTARSGYSGVIIESMHPTPKISHFPDEYKKKFIEENQDLLDPYDDET